MKAILTEAHKDNKEKAFPYPPSFPSLPSVQIRFVKIRVIRVAPPFSQLPPVKNPVPLSCISCISRLNPPVREDSERGEKEGPNHSMVRFLNLKRAGTLCITVVRHAKPMRVALAIKSTAGRSHLGTSKSGDSCGVWHGLSLPSHEAWN